MDDMAIIYKSIGETPLEALEHFRVKRGIESGIPMTYAGRLDPMAEGLLLILIGEKCKEKDQYLNYDKTYEFEILLGFETDTYDLLGIVTKSENMLIEDFKKIEDLIKDITAKSLGIYRQKYPAYSSKTINGIQMFELARSGKLDEKDIPQHNVEIKCINFLESREIVGTNLFETIKTNILKITGDFRQNEILEKWRGAIKLENSYLALKFEVVCSGGFYVRAFTDEICRKLNISMTTYSIKRTKIGKFETISE